MICHATLYPATLYDDTINMKSCCMRNPHHGRLTVVVQSSDKDIVFLDSIDTPRPEICRVHAHSCAYVVAERGKSHVCKTSNPNNFANSANLASFDFEAMECFCCGTICAMQVPEGTEITDAMLSQVRACTCSLASGCAS